MLRMAFKMFPILVSWFHQIRIVQQKQIEKHWQEALHFWLPILRTCKQLPEKAVSGKGTGEVSPEKKLKYQVA